MSGYSILSDALPDNNTDSQAAAQSNSFFFKKLMFPTYLHTKH